MLGEAVGSYRIIGKLGEGGMGMVYLAEHPLIGRKAAVKVLRPEFSRDPDIVNRFFNEARATTLIKHPGIVDIFDFGHHAGGSAFIIMEYLDGESLAARLDRESPMAPELVVDLSKQLAHALHAAHQKSIVHRDLKPDNVHLVSAPELPYGVRTKLLDFGIAKLASDGTGSMRTRTGAMMGTPTYMSPEQCRGAGHVDHRSDIYSLGCMMYEMLAGRPPFAGEGPGDIIAAHIYATPPALSSLNPSLPAALVAIVERMLVKNPEQRLANMSEVLAQLETRRESPRTSAVRPASAEPRAAQLGGGAPRNSTTLGSSAAEVVRVAPGNTHRGRRIATVVAVAAVGSLAALMLLRPTHAPSPSSASSPTATAASDKASSSPAAASRDVAPAKSAAAPAALQPLAAAPKSPAEPPSPSVNLELTSSPSGAAVFRSSDGARVGTTPLHTQAKRANGKVGFVVKLKGYADQVVTFSTIGDGKQTVILAGTHRTHRAKKAIANGVLDPFGQ
jgi:serine/threonine-protein kinase